MYGFYEERVRVRRYCALVYNGMDMVLLTSYLYGSSTRFRYYRHAPCKTTFVIVSSASLLDDDPSRAICVDR